MKIKKILLLLFAASTLVACSKSKADKRNAINKLQKSEAMGTTEGLNQLAILHKEYGMSYDDAEGNNYLYAAAQYYFYEKEFDEAKPLLAAYINRDDSTEQFRNAALNLAVLFANKADFSSADDLISAVLEKGLPSAAQWQDIIKLYENKIATKADLEPHDYERLSLAYTAANRFSEATASLQTAIHDFPAYEKRANLMYRAGFVCWEYAKDTKAAKVFYEAFLAEYPNDPRTEEVKIILSAGMLKMSDEAIIEMLKGETK